MAQAQYYSMRQLSPYQGTVQVIQDQGSRAMSADGITWQVQIKRPGARYSIHGVWRRDGSGDLKQDKDTASFIKVLRNAPLLPFPFQDNLELWLLCSQSTLPLALIASTLDRESAPRISDAQWQATLSEDYSFVASSLVPNKSGTDTSLISHRDVLNRCVKTAAGSRPQAQWFRRAEDDSGLGLTGCRIEGDLGRRVLSAEVFPELLIREQWPHKEETALVRDYHAWQAAHLLTHAKLSEKTRDWLERSACLQSEDLYQVRKLLPHVINQGLIKKALVEATIRRSNMVS